MSPRIAAIMGRCYYLPHIVTPYSCNHGTVLLLASSLACCNRATAYCLTAGLTNMGESSSRASATSMGFHRFMRSRAWSTSWGMLQLTDLRNLARACRKRTDCTSLWPLYVHFYWNYYMCHHVVFGTNKHLLIKRLKFLLNAAFETFSVPSDRIRTYLLLARDRIRTYLLLTREVEPELPNEVLFFRWQCFRWWISNNWLHRCKRNS